MAFERCHDPEELQRLVGGASSPTHVDGGGAMAMGSMMSGGDYV